MNKESVRSFCARIIREYPGTFRTDLKFLYCVYCDCPLSGNKTSNVKQHLTTTKHQKAVETKKKGDAFKQTLVADHLHPKPPDKFRMDLCKTFLEADIPLKKISHPSVVQFIENYTGKAMPSESTLRQKFVPHLYNERIETLRAKAQNKFIWTSIDETTDSEGRMVANFIYGILESDENSTERGKCYLLNVVEVEAANANTMATFFNDSLLLLWTNGK